VAARIHSLKTPSQRQDADEVERPARKVYVVETSTHLLDWEAAGTETVNGDGSFEFDDPQTPNITAGSIACPTRS
jgi:hypothetical protein